MRQQPRFLALYVARPQSRILYFAKVADIKDAADKSLPESLRREDSEGKKILILDESSIVRLSDPIPRGSFGLRGLIYKNLSELKTASSLNDLYNSD